MKGLYHYTSTYHLPKILEAGFIQMSQGILNDCAVWLTTSTNAEGNGLQGSIVNKSEIRFIMKDINAIKWADYKRKIIKGENKAEKKQWAEALETNQKPYSWYLSSSIIYLDQVEAIENTFTDKKVVLEGGNFDKDILKILL